MSTQEPTLNLRQIAPRGGSQADAFEALCCSLVRRENSPHGSFRRVRGEGGDGGVECLWTDPQGALHGWQVKYIFGLGKALPKVAASIAEAVRRYPSLRHYTVCLPFTLSGSQGRGKGKSQLEKFEDFCAKQEHISAQAGVPLKIGLWDESEILDRLLAQDHSGGLRRYWFDVVPLSTEWFDQNLAAAMVLAGPRYNPELHHGHALDAVLSSLGRTEGWQKIRLAWLERIAGWPLDRFKSVPHSAEALVATLERAREAVVVAMGTERALVEGRIVAEGLDAARQLERVLTDDLNERFGEGKSESVQFRQWEAEYNGRFPAQPLDDSRVLVDEFEELSRWLDDPGRRAAQEGVLVVTGRAGIGKTHGLCDAARRRAAQGLQTILLMGEQFDDRGPVWTQIRDALGLDASWGRDELFDAVEESNATSGYPMALFIDALDESRPRSLWRQQLPELLQFLHGRSGLVLCVSLRDSYSRQVIRADLDLPTFTHPGFSGDPFNACTAFFAHHKLQPPLGPLLNPEFENPLFLLVVCRTLQSMGASALPMGWDGMAQVLHALLEQRDRELQEAHPGVGTRAVTRAMVKLAAATMEDQVMTRSRADQLLQESLPASQRVNVDLLDRLLHLGFLKQAPGPSAGWDVGEDHITLAFARLRDHLLSEHFASMLDGRLDDSEVLRRVVDAAIADPGLAEALALALPEQLGVELLGLAEESDVEFDLIMRAWLRALPWRSRQTLETRLVDVHLQIALHQGWAMEALDALLVLALRAGQPFDHRYLHRILADMPLPIRDSGWCWYTHERFEESTSHLARLLRAPWEANIEALDGEVRGAWVTVLCWCMAAADRRVRDHATKAAVRLSEGAPGLWPTIVQNFADVDDDAVFERVLCAAYGAVLRNPVTAAIAELAAVVGEIVFSDRGRRWSHALVRHYARGIGELAVRRGGMSVGSVERFRPPHESEWPLEIPTEADLAAYATPEGRRQYPRLYESCTDTFAGDFAIYTVRHALEPYARGLSLDAARRWILRQVMDLGYSPEYHAAYDVRMLSRYGGGRARPGWAERIGKKYQRIALNRLVARVSDHIERDKHSWERDTEPLPSETLRDTDPSVLLHGGRERVLQPPESPWWEPVSMDFESTRELSDEAWVGEDDFPNFEELVRALEDPSHPGRRWRLLDGQFSWNDRMNPREYRTPARDVWVVIHGYFLPRQQLRKCWARLLTCDFMGGRIGGGGGFSEVIIGEYPWAPSFEQQRKHEFSPLDSRGELPFDLQPAANQLTSSFDEDTWQQEPLHVRVPSIRLVEATATRWDGLGGFVTDTGRCVFVDPAFQAGGPSVLLMDDEVLQRVLDANDSVLLWTVLAERRVALARAQFPGQKHVSHVMRLDGDRIRRSRKPVGEHITATRERVEFGPRGDVKPLTEGEPPGLSQADIDLIRKLIGPNPEAQTHGPTADSEEDDG